MLSQGQRRKQDATLALLVLRGNDYDPGEELNEMQAASEACAGGNVTLLDMFKSPSQRKAMLASFGMMFFQQASGVNAVIFYTVMIFEASGSSMPPTLASIVVAFVQVGKETLRSRSFGRTLFTLNVVRRSW